MDDARCVTYCGDEHCKCAIRPLAVRMRLLDEFELEGICHPELRQCSDIVFCGECGTRGSAINSDTDNCADCDRAILEQTHEQ